MEFTKNQLLELEITDISETGEGIGHVDGYTLFVKDALVGDEVSALITKAKKNYSYARVNKIIKSSPDRVEPKCSNASRCGGCQIQALSYDAQLRYKQDKVFNDLIRIGGFAKEDIEKVMEPIVGADKDGIYRYRNKAQFPVGTDRDGNVISGFYAGRTHSIIPCDDCYIGIEENAVILDSILEYMRKNAVTAYDEKTLKGIVRHVLIRKGFTTGQIMVCLVLASKGKVTYSNDYAQLSVLPNQDELVSALSAINGVYSICVSINTENTNVIMGNEIHLLYGSKTISDYIHLRNVNNDFELQDKEGIRFDISPLSFYQVNPVQVEKLYSIALDYAGLNGNEEIWDLCCGIGTISLCAAKYLKNMNANSTGIVHGIEIVPQAIEDAKSNAFINKIDNVEFVCAAAEEYLPAHRDEIKADVIIMDPPRKGMDVKALEVVVLASPDKIVYISCDPATLARDLKYLCENGYEIVRVRPTDMFMHSVHVETVCLLSRKS